jgi:hypothetical protein
VLIGKHCPEKNPADSESLRLPPSIRESTKARSYNVEHAGVLCIQTALGCVADHQPRRGDRDEEARPLPSSRQAALSERESQRWRHDEGDQQQLGPHCRRQSSMLNPSARQNENASEFRQSLDRMGEDVDNRVNCFPRSVHDALS